MDTNDVQCFKKVRSFVKWYWPKVGISRLQLLLEFKDGFEMMQKGWSSIKEVSYCFFKVIRQILRSHGKKNWRYWHELSISGLYPQFEFTNGFEMMHKAWSHIEDVPYCFSRSSVKFQGHTRQKIADFDPNLVFPDCNSLLITNGFEMMYKAWSSVEEVPYSFSRSFVKFQGHMGQEITNFDPNWAFPKCNSSFNTLMALEWCTKLDIV